MNRIKNLVTAVEKINKEHWIWQGHAGHFICGHRCSFKLNTIVGKGKRKYIVSTVGEMLITLGNDEKYDDIGFNRKYETMVFRAKKSKYTCCPYVAVVSIQKDFKGYNSAEEATKGHFDLCLKWDK